MELTKNEVHLLKYVRAYKYISIGCMIFGVHGIGIGLYNDFHNLKPYYDACLNYQLMAISLSVIGMGYLMYCFTKIIEKVGRHLSEDEREKLSLQRLLK